MPFFTRESNFLNRTTSAAVLAACIALVPTTTHAADIDFAPGDESSWRVVLDGVMGGLSSGRVQITDPGILRFSGELSLENNGGFSQIRSNVKENSFLGADGVEVRFMGDGREYRFDIRSNQVRMMAGSYQTAFQTTKGEWMTVRMPFDGFRLYSFGRLITRAPALDPVAIESVGVTLSDKKTGAFELKIDSIRSYTNGSVAQPSSSNNATKSSSTNGDSSLSAVAKGAGLTTLLSLVDAADLKLPANERVTIFAPTNDAFAQLPKDLVSFLTSPEGKDTLRSVLSYHVVIGDVASSDLLSRSVVSTANTQRLSVSTDNGLRVNESRILAVDVPFDGGTVHVIDKVFIPELSAISELLLNTSELSTLLAAVDAAGLADQLGPENAPWTVFAPVNSAFSDLPDGVLASLLESKNRNTLIEILGLHVVPGKIYSNELLVQGRAQTLFGSNIKFSLDGGELVVNGARIITSDVEASNGVVHLIEEVLLPAPEQVTQAKSGIDVRERAASLYQLAIDRGVPLFNDGQEEACAAIYEITLQSMLILLQDASMDSMQQPVTATIETALDEASDSRNWRERAWIYRRALDRAYAYFTQQS
ncbi:MAG: CIA30 family protein [Phycisphaerales bacterium]